MIMKVLQKVILFSILLPVLVLLYALGVVIAAASVFAAPLIVWKLVSTYIDIPRHQ